MTISYAGAAGWLESLPDEDRDDQIRDWAIQGLAPLIGLDPEGFRDAFYDRTPVRDPLFLGLATESVGPGRGLPDKFGRLYVLAPQGDPYFARTVGLVLDDYRKDHDADPQQVFVYRYEINHENQSVRLSPEITETADTVRKRYGYREMQIDALPDLERFLAETQHLSRLEVRKGKLWASGWNWPNTPAGRITTADLTVLQQGYRKALDAKNKVSQTRKNSNTPLTTEERRLLEESREPGFSLDPGKKMTVRETIDLLDSAKYAPLKARASEVAAFLGAYANAKSNREVQELSSKLDDDLRKVIRDIFTQDPKLAELLLRAAQGRSPYQFARYYGGLKGTDAGMTYFYTDIVGKTWPMEIGSGNPAGIVPGFVSNLKAQTPWGHCSTTEESGRLWFGLRNEGVSINENHVNLGSLTTRMFSRVNDSQNRDVEVEPSYSFGRIMWWWDRHYQAMADYEPQYHRLDQLMRWGAAIAWLTDNNASLTETKPPRLPEVAPDQIKRDWRFGDWMTAHSAEVKWAFDIPFVHPPAETTETLLRLYSDTYSDCGINEQYWSGGISNPSLFDIQEIFALRPKQLTQSVARAGLTEKGTTFTPATHSGDIVDFVGNVRRTLSAVQQDAAQVTVHAEGREVWSMGLSKTTVSKEAPRQIEFDMRIAPGQTAQKLTVQGIPYGELNITSEATIASVRWEPSLLDKLRRSLDGIQKALGNKQPLQAAADAASDAMVSYADPAANRIRLGLDSENAVRWVSLEAGEPVFGKTLGFRLGAPGTDGVTWYKVEFAEAPSLAEVSRTGWISLQPGVANGPVRLVSASSPGEGAVQIRVLEAGSRRTGTLWVEGRTVLAKADDPVVGLKASANGFHLQSPESIEAIRNAQRAASEAGDGYRRVVELPNQGFVFVDANDTILVAPDNPWHTRIQAVIEAAGPDKAKTMVKIEGDRALAVVASDAPVKEVTRSAMTLGDYLKLQDGSVNPSAARPPPIYLTREILEEGRLPSSAIGLGRQVRVVEIEAPDVALEGAARPDLIHWDRTEWHSLPSNPLPLPAPAGPGAPGATATPMTASGTSGDGRIILVFGADDCSRQPDYARCR